MPNRSTSSLFYPRYWPTWLAVGLLRLLLFLPYPALMATGATLGRLIHLFAPRRKHIADVNLQMSFPEMSAAQRRRLIKDNFAAMGMGLMEVGMGWWWPQQRVEKLLKSVEGEEYLTAGEGSTGTIFLTAHFTSLELASYVGRRTAGHVMYRRNENPVIEWLFEQYRGLYALGIIPRDDVRSVVRALRAGEGVWFAPDQNYGHKGSVFADFLGVPAATNTATSRFAQLTGARVVPFVLLRVAGGYRLIAEPPLADFPSDDPVKDTQRINDIMSRWVELAPEQYNWIHRRFKDRPDGAPSPYL